MCEFNLQLCFGPIIKLTLIQFMAKIATWEHRCYSMWWCIFTIRERKSDCRTVFFRPVSWVSLPCFRCVPDSNDRFVIELIIDRLIYLNQVCQSRITSKNMHVEKHCFRLSMTVIKKYNCYSCLCHFLLKPQRATGCRPPGTGANLTWTLQS